jgi:hypothetical protein
MSYEVKLHPKVDKFLKKCGKELEERIRNKLRLLKEEPFKYLEHYEGEESINKSSRLPRKNLYEEGLGTTEKNARKKKKRPPPAGQHCLPTPCSYSTLQKNTSAPQAPSRAATPAHIGKKVPFVNCKQKHLYIN